MEGDWWATGCHGTMWSVKLLVGEYGFHSIGYVGTGEVWWCEHYRKGGCKLVDHVLGEGVKEDGACFHVGDDGFPQLFEVAEGGKGKLELLEVFMRGHKGSCQLRCSWG